MSNYNYQKPQNLATLSNVVYECLCDAWQPTFGMLFPDSDDLTPVQTLLADEDTEFAADNIHILSDDDDILGVTAVLPLSALKSVRQKTLFKMIDMVDDKAAFMKNMTEYAQRFPTLPDEDGVYLSKFAIARNRRGKGFADILMQHFLDEYNQGMPYFLEVHQDNAAAIALYKKHGFAVASAEDGKEYYLMKRNP